VKILCLILSYYFFKKIWWIKSPINLVILYPDGFFVKLFGHCCEIKSNTWYITGLLFCCKRFGNTNKYSDWNVPRAKLHNKNINVKNTLSICFCACVFFTLIYYFTNNIKYSKNYCRVKKIYCFPVTELHFYILYNTMHTNSLRFLQKKILHIQKKIVFKTSHISSWWKLTLFWVLLCFISLFISWGGAFWNIVDAENIENFRFNSFSSVLWYIGYFILGWLGLISFSIASIKKKQKLKYFSLIEIRDYSASIISSIVIFLATLHSFFITIWLQLFSSNITHASWIILCMTGSIIIFIWGIVIKWEYRMNIKWSYINSAGKSPQESEFKDKKDNMKLPF